MTGRCGMPYLAKLVVGIVAGVVLLAVAVATLVLI